MVKKSKKCDLDFDSLEMEVAEALAYFPTEEDSFLDMVTHPDNGLHWLPDAYTHARRQWERGDKAGAFCETIKIISHLSRQVAILCAAIHAQEGMIERECKRRGAQAKARTTAAEERKKEGLKKCRELLDKNPHTKQTALAKQCGVTVRTISRWLGKK